jgi:LPXTG-site transpeptidase (sortase) family protein
MTARVRVKSFGRLLMQLSADLLVFAGFGFLMFFAWSWTDSTVYQRTQKAAFVQKLAAPALPDAVEAVAADPKIVGKLEVPRLGISVMVRDGVDAVTLRRAAGRLPSSAFPGQAGNLVILAHRDTFFRPLRYIAQNDIVIVRTAQGSFTYQVVLTTVEAPESESWREVQTAPKLTLITCFPFYYVGPAPQRFIVTARLVSTGDAGLSARAPRFGAPNAPK